MLFQGRHLFFLEKHSLDTKLSNPCPIGSGFHLIFLVKVGFDKNDKTIQPYIGFKFWTRPTIFTNNELGLSASRKVQI